MENIKLITNLEGFAKWFGCDSVDKLERALYKYTDCGMCYEDDEKGITLIGYVEGCDGAMPTEYLEYPFSEEDAQETIEMLEIEADRVWHEWNDDEDDENDCCSVEEEIYNTSDFGEELI